MVNYQSPVTIQEDYSAYAFCPALESPARLTTLSFSIAAVEKLYHVFYGIYM